MTHPCRRASGLVLASACLVALTAGCDSRKPTTGAGGPAVSVPTRDVESAALAELATRPDLDHCRQALQVLDNQESAGRRPVLSAAEKAELAAFLRLTDAELSEAGQTAFSLEDAAYLEEALLVRAGVRSLKIDARPPLERARLGFDWACRMVYVDDRVSWPANPWSTLQSGSGIALSRAYVVLAAWQQLGLDGCLVGPPALKSTPSMSGPTAAEPGAKPSFAPVRACGVKVGSDVFLFDPAAGHPVSAPDGKGVLTLAQARANPDAVKALAKDDDAKAWQPFLAPPLPGLSRRMESLEQRNPGGVGPRLFVDLAGLRARFAKDLPGIPVDAWNVPGDALSPGRVLARYATEEATPTTLPLRQRHRLFTFPLDRIPKVDLAGNALGHFTMSFARPFEMLRYTPGSARDLMVRGQLGEALTALDNMKNLVDNARARIDRDPGLQKDFEKWADEFQSLSAQLIRAEQNDPANAAAARRALEQFRANPRNMDIERAYVLGHAARPLAAEVAFLTATAVQERAERAQLDGSAQAAGNWQNARFWWNQFLDASAQARTPFPAREAHARAHLARAQQHLPK